MAILRAGLVLFLLVTVVAAAIGWGFLGLGGINGGSLDLAAYLGPMLPLCVATFATSILLMVLAWRGRRQPLSDGIAIMTVLLLIVAYGVSIAYAGYEPTYPDSNPVFFVWMAVSAYLACLVPAYLFSYLALCRTPLLRGLAPLPKNKGPAEASP